MLQLIKILEIKPCGCDAEGKIVVLLIDAGIRIECDYQTSDEHIKRLFPLGSIQYADISLWLDTIKLTDKRELTLQPSVIGKYTGVVNKDDDDFFGIDSVISILATNEFNDYQEPAVVGQWVEAKGSFYIEWLDS